MKSSLRLLSLLLAVTASLGTSLRWGEKGLLELKLSSEGNAFEVNIVGLDDSVSCVHGLLGLSLPSVLPAATEITCPIVGSYIGCFQWGDFAQLNIQARSSSAGVCYRFEWNSTYAREIEDCYDLDPAVHWYGGGEMYTQIWPIETRPRLETPYIPMDSLGDRDRWFGGIAERYLLLSNGASIVLDPYSPVFFSLNSTRPNKVCFTARDQVPYTKRSPLNMSYEWCTAPDVKAAHQAAVARYFDKPTGIPDERMLVQPLWSTWAEYKSEVNQSIVLDYARKVISEGFRNTSHIEIDDLWEPCYGEEEFDLIKFPDPKAMIDEIHQMGMRATAWVTPFVNYGCPRFNEGMEKGYFVKNSKNKLGITSWWQGENSAIIDMTNPDAVEWWTGRLRKLQEETGLDSYKFDAGEGNWLPASAALAGDDKLWPQIYTSKFVEACTTFGDLIEVRVGHLTQEKPIFIRMLDKDSNWGYGNGLRSMIPTVLHFGIQGYPFVLPDMIGGNNYFGEDITQEFYMRWMQVNAFMPGLQFSLVPWRIGKTEEERKETVRLCLEVIALREKYAEHILAAARQSADDGSPMNKPIWWADPKDPVTFTIDDEYLLGDSILVAPVLDEGRTTRDIYLPAGRWIAETDSVVHTGPVWLRDYPAPISVVPIFVKSD